MATISAPDLVLLRTGHHKVTPYLSVLQPATLLSALVNDGAIARGARSIAYDTGGGSAANFAKITEGQTLAVVTADGTKRVRVKSITGNEVSGTITVDENGIDWGDGDALTILQEYRIWPVFPRISSNIFYKYYDLVYSNQNTQPPPVAIAGPHRAGFLSAGSIVFSISGADSYAIASGATITGYAWACTGGTIANAAIATTTITFTTAGTYWLKLTVTDSNSQTQVTYRAIFVHDSSSMPYTKFSLSNVNGSWQSGGYRFTVSATGDVTLGDFPDETLCVLWYTGQINNSEDYVNLWATGDNVICAGYLRGDSDNDDYKTGAGQVEFEVVTPDAILDAMTEFGSVSITAEASPTTWYEYASWLTVGRAVHHLLRWHSTAFTCVDIYGLTTNTLGMQQANFAEPSLLQQVNSLGYQRGHFAKMVSDRLGRLHFVTDSQMLNDAGRGALDTVFSITNADISGGINLTRRPIETVGYADLDGFSFDGSTGTPFISIAPGYVDSISITLAEFRGTGGTSTKNQVLNDQTDSNEKAGRVLAAANNPVGEIRLGFRGNYLGAFDIVPSIGWYTWGIADADLKRALGLNGANLLCRTVDQTIDVAGGNLTTSAVFETEAEGADGIPGNYPTSYPAQDSNAPGPEWDEPFTPGEPVDLFLFNTANISICPLASNSALVVGNDVSDSYHLKAVVLSITGGALSAGAVNTVASVTVGSFQICRMTDASVLLAYNDIDDGSKCKVKVLTVSGTTVTPQTADSVTSNTTSYVVVDRFGTTTNYIVAFNETGGGGVGACIIAASGTAAASFTPAYWVSNDDLSLRGIACHASNDATAVYYDVINSTMYGIVLSNAAGTITPGTETDLGIDNTQDHAGPHNVAAVAADTVVITNVDSGNFIRNLGISGDTITTNSAASGGGFAVAKISSALVVAGYPSTDTVDPGYSRTFAISGSSTTASGDETQFDADDIDMVDVAYLVDGYGIAVYKEDATNYCYAKLIPVSA